MRFEDVLFWLLTGLTVFVIVAGISLSSNESPIEEIEESVQEDAYSVTVQVLPEDQIPENATCYPVEGEYMVYCSDGKLYID